MATSHYNPDPPHLGSRHHDRIRLVTLPVVSPPQSIILHCHGFNFDLFSFHLTMCVNLTAYCYSWGEQFTMACTPNPGLYGFLFGKLAGHAGDVASEQL